MAKKNKSNVTQEEGPSFLAVSPPPPPSSLNRVLTSIRATVTEQTTRQRALDVVWNREDGSVSDFTSEGKE
jgi:hypothetical protein